MAPEQEGAVPWFICLGSASALPSLPDSFSAPLGTNEVVFADQTRPSITNPVLGLQASVMLLSNPSLVLQHSFGRLHHALKWSNARQHSPVECQSSSAAYSACDLDTFRGITEISSTGNQGLCLTKKFGEGASSGRAPRRCRISRLFTETLDPSSSTITSGHIRLECHYIQDSTLEPFRGVFIGPSRTHL